MRLKLASIFLVHPFFGVRGCLMVGVKIGIGLVHPILENFSVLDEKSHFDIRIMDVIHHKWTAKNNEHLLTLIGYACFHGS